MNSQPKKIPKPTFEKTDELIRLAADAVTQAQEESRQLGIPNVYSVNGQIYSEESGKLVPDSTDQKNGE